MLEMGYRPPAETTQPKDVEVNPDVQMLTPSDLEVIRTSGGSGPEVRFLQRLSRQLLNPTGGTYSRRGETLYFETFVDPDPAAVAKLTRGDMIGSAHNKPAWAGGGIETRFDLHLGSVPQGVDIREVTRTRTQPPARP